MRFSSIFSGIALTAATLFGAASVSAQTGISNITIVWTADNHFNLTFNGTDVLGPYNRTNDLDPWQQVQTQTFFARGGRYVLGISAINTGGPSGLIATVIVNNRAIKSTGDGTWRALDVMPAPGWNTSLTFDESDWRDVAGDCSETEGVWGNTTEMVRKPSTDYGGRPAQWIWYPSCNSDTNNNWYRAIIEVPNDGNVPLPSPSPLPSAAPLPSFGGDDGDSGSSDSPTPPTRNRGAISSAAKMTVFSASASALASLICAAAVAVMAM